MDKIAQKRSLRSKVWEGVNLTGIFLEKYHAELGQAMDEIRETDTTVRELAADVKPLVRQAKSLFRRRNYLECSFSLAQFHQIVRNINLIFSKLSSEDKIKHIMFILDNSDPSKKKELFKYNPQADIKKSCEDFDQMVKEAGIYDWMKDKALSVKDYISDTSSNIVTNEGRARRLLEKRFSGSFIKEVADSTSKLLAATQKMLNTLLFTFSVMESGVSRRNIKLYMEQTKKFTAEFKKYHDVYMLHDKNILEPLRAHQNKIDQERKTTEEQRLQEEQLKREEQEKKELEEANKSPFVSKYLDTPSKDDAIPTVTNMPPSIEEKNKVHELLEEKRNEHDKKDVKNPKSPRKLMNLDDPYDLSHITKNDSIFIKQLIKLAETDNLNGFVSNILKQSENLENSNPAQSEALLHIAQEIINDYKQAGWFDRLKGKINPDTVNDMPTQNKQQPANKNKPQELIDSELNQYKMKKIDLPDGRIDQGFSDIPVLSNITPDKIKLSYEAVSHLKINFIRRLMDVQNIEDFEPYVNSVDQRLIGVLKNAIIEGWVISSHNVQDTFNPRDKYLEVYTRMNLSDIDSKLSGVAKLNLTLRLSADHGTVSLKNVKKHFTIENVKEKHKSEKNIKTDRTSTKIPEAPNTKRLLEEDDDESDVDHDQYDDLDYPE